MLTKASFSGSSFRRILALAPILAFSKPVFFSTSIDHNYFDFGQFVIPHPEKVEKGGEDAYFSNKQVLAVADGVGGWAEHGVDPAIYSRKLCANIAQLLETNGFEKYSNNPKLLVKQAADNNQEEGSSTLVVLTLPGKGDIMYTSYVGDSGYVILRPVNMEKTKYEIQYESKEQTKGFNFPFQLGWRQNGDNPSCALEFNHKMKQDDIVVVGSDGLFDNITGTQIKDFVEDHLKNNRYDSSVIARGLAKMTYGHSLNPAYNSPFAIRARDYGYRFNGGKSDDITIVVGKVN